MRKRDLLKLHNRDMVRLKKTQATAILLGEPFVIRDVGKEFIMVDILILATQEFMRVVHTEVE